MPEESPLEAKSPSDGNGDAVETGQAVPVEDPDAEERKQFEQSLDIWPPVRGVLFGSGTERPVEVYFPLELSNSDYATRVLQWTGHALREIYAYVVAENMAPPARDGSVPLDVEHMDTPRVFRHCLSPRAVHVYAGLINLDLVSFKGAIEELQDTEKRLCSEDASPWTNLTISKLFDVGMRVVSAASSVGFSNHIYQNLTSLSRQYEKHMVYRQQRLRATLSVQTARQVEQDEGFSSPLQQARNEPREDEGGRRQFGHFVDDQEDEESFGEKRRRLLAHVLVCERKMKALPPMEGSGKEGEEGAGDMLSRDAEARFVLMDSLRRCREEEAHRMREGQLKQAEQERARGREISEKVHRRTDAVQFAWSRVAPAALERETAHLAGDVGDFGEEAAKDRNYEEAAELKDALRRLGHVRRQLDERRKLGVAAEQGAERKAMVKVFRLDVEDIGVRISALPALFEGTPPPVELLEAVAAVERRIAKLASQWVKDQAKQQRPPSTGQPAIVASSSRPVGLVRRRSSVTEYKPAPTSKEALELETLLKQVRRFAERIHWRKELCLLMAEVVAASEDDAAKIVLERLAHALEPSQADLAGKVAAMLLEEASDSITLCQRMDNWHALATSAAEKGRTLVQERRKQRKRWDGTKHKDVGGWMVVSFGSWGRGDDSFREPCAIAINKLGQYLVADRSNHRIQVLTAGGKLWKTVGSRGSGPGELESPSGVAVGKEGEIVVADRGNNRVVVFSPKGAFLRDMGEGVGSGARQFQGPSSVAVGSQGDVYVGDYGNHKVKVFSIEGELLRVLGDSIERSARLHYPAGVAVTEDGVVLVADSGNHRVVALTGDGELVKEYQGGKAGDKADLHAPLGVAVGPAGEIVVSDSGHHRLLVLDAEGNLLRSFGSKGPDLGELQCPRGVAVSAHGLLAIADYGNHRLVLCEQS